MTWSGCSGGRLSADKARAATVVEVGDAKLVGAKLEDWLAQSPVAPTTVSAALLLSSWLDQTLLDQAMRSGAMIDDSATIDLAIAPDAARGMLLDFWETRAKARPAVTDAQADSLSDVDRVRVYQQLVVQLPPGLDSVAAAPIIARVRSLATRAHAPDADFTALIREVSKDSTTLARRGFMPALTRAELPPEVSGAIWALQPGEVSGILGSSVGAHMFRRATRIEAREGLKQWLAPQLALRAEQRFADSLTTALGLKFSADAVVRVRAMAPEPVPAAEGPPLASWSGGELTASTVRSWITMLGPNERALLSVTSDSAASRFLRELAQRQMLLAVASPAVAPPNASARAALAPQYRQALDTAKTRLRDVTTGSAAGGAGSAFVDAILSQRIFYRPLPGNLGGILRSRAKATVNRPALEGVVAAANRAWREKHANDTTATGAAKATPSPLDRIGPVVTPDPVLPKQP
ncbi:MAG: peptidylprolyl isomerase [Gemmatimonadota bacterium]